MLFRLSDMLGWARATKAGRLNVIPSRLIPKTLKNGTFYQFRRLCLVCGNVHARCCQWLATSIHFESNLVAHGASKRNWVPQATRGSPAGVQKLHLNEIYLQALCCFANFDSNAFIFNFDIDLTLEHEIFCEPAHLSITAKMYSWWPSLYLWNCTIAALIRDIIADHKATYDAENPRDFIDVFIGEMMKKEDKYFTVRKLFSVAQICFQNWDFRQAVVTHWSVHC